MEDDYISISTLNDFYFCPYSIFLHNVYMETDESFYHAAPQVRGRLAHEAVDNKKASNRKDEPFRCIIDKTVRSAINRNQICEADFDVFKGEYRLKLEKNKEYSRLFFDSLVPYKSEIFKYVQSFYRCFMGGKDAGSYPRFEI